MNDNETKLVAALRSGEFAQGYGALKYTGDDGPKHCCLGVACEVFRRETGQGEWEAPVNGLRNGMTGFRIDEATSDSFLPNRVRKWLGWENPSGMLRNAAGNSLVNMNDDERSFEEIADVIERGRVQ